MYHLTWRIRVTAPLDAELLGRAWQLVVDRHEALRTGFARRDGALVQVIHGAAETELERLGWRAPGDDAPPRASDALLEELATQLHTRPFDLESPPLARATLVTVGERQELVITVHHMVLDGWALQLVMSDLETAYRAQLDGTPPNRGRIFTEPAEPYRPFADRARQPPTPAEREFWTRQLRDTRLAALRPDRPASARPGATGAVLRHRRPAAVGAAVAEIAARVGCTPFAVQLAALRAVLALGGAGGRSAVGVVVANRMTPQDQRCVGYCGNVVLLADTVASSDTFDEVVGRARDALWESLPFQHLPLSDVVTDLPATDRAALGTGPEILITYHGQIGSGLALGGRPAELLPSPSTSARCQVLLGLFEDADGEGDGVGGGGDGSGAATIEVEYDTGRLDEATVRGLLTDLDRLLIDSARAGGPLSAVTTGTRAETIEPGPRSPVPAPTSAQVSEPPADASQEGVDQQLLDIWGRVLGVPVQPDDDFFALDGHSLQVLELIASVEEATGQQVDVADWLDQPTPRRMAELTGHAPQLPDATPAHPASPVHPASSAHPASVPPPERSDGLRVLSPGEPGGPHLHLVHGAGVGRLPYREVADGLPSAWRVTVSEDDGGSDGTLAGMAERYLDSLLAEGQLPDVLGGWSMGGLLAHAMAERVQRAGHRVPPLLILDAPPPDHVYDLQAADFGFFMDCVLRGAGAAHTRPDELSPTDHHSTRHSTHHSTELGIAALTALLRRAGLDTRPDALRERFALHHRHQVAMAAYQGVCAVDAAVLLVAADLDDGGVRQWERWSSRELSTVRVPTDHYGLLRGDHARRVAGLATGLLAPAAKP